MSVMSYTLQVNEGMNQRGGKLPAWPVAVSAWRVLRYHLGSMLLGSAVVPPAQLLRSLFDVILYSSLSKEQRRNNLAGLSSACYCCCCAYLRCYISCNERCLNYVTHWASYFVSIESVSFCTGASATLRLAVKHEAQARICGRVTTSIWFVQCLFAPFLTLFVFEVYRFLNDTPAEEAREWTGR